MINDMKKKSDFVMALLAEKNLSSQEREKIIDLGFKELSDERNQLLLKVLDDETTKIHENIKRLDDKVDELISKNLEIKKSTTVVNKPIVTESNTKKRKSRHKGLPKKQLNPYWTYKFLESYNQNFILKSTCHEIDSNELRSICKYCETQEYDFNKHLLRIKEEFEKHSKRIAPPFIKAMIRTYLTGTNQEKNDKGWSEDDIKVNWCSNDVRFFSMSNNIPPNLSRQLQKQKNLSSLKFTQFKSKINGNTIQNFRELTLHFKNLIHFRDDNSLKSVLVNINEQNEYENKVNFIINDDEFPTNIEIFTDVDKVGQAYDEIINLIIKKHKNEEKPKVQLKLTQTKESVKLSIHHLNSIYLKSLEDFKKRPIGQTYENLIKNQIHGIMNFYLRAELQGNQHISVNLYNEEERIIDQELLPNFSGVEHIFEFKKTK